MVRKLIRIICDDANLKKSIKGFSNIILFNNIKNNFIRSIKLGSHVARMRRRLSKPYKY
jgi:hypothetical protein